MKLLIADDSRIIRATIARYLANTEFEIIEAEDGMQAIETLEEGEVQIAVLDWHMPGMSGVDICRRFANHPNRARVFIMIITAQEGVSSLAEAFDAGCQDYINKPFNQIELLARVRSGRRIIGLQTQLAQSQKLESIGQLAAGISHEINTPIQYVGDNLRFLHDAFEQLKDGVMAGAATDATNELEFLIEEIPSAISQSLDGVDRVASIVRAMKEFAHPGTQEKSFIDIHQTIDNTITVSSNEWKYFANIERQFSEDMPMVPCLPSEINQVFLNLVINAAHAIADVVGPDSSEKGTITVQTRLREQYASIEISDTGTGIKPDILGRIFDPFFTSKGVGKGTGQGLSIAHNVVVNKHGGKIEVDSTVGKGTTFRILLPLAKTAAHPTLPNESDDATPEKTPETSASQWSARNVNDRSIPSDPFSPELIQTMGGR